MGRSKKKPTHKSSILTDIVKVYPPLAKKKDKDKVIPPNKMQVLNQSLAVVALKGKPILAFCVAFFSKKCEKKFTYSCTSD